jgi:bifunctional lysine-specific demethylase and histidyl-hydroxylase NO66
VTAHLVERSSGQRSEYRALSRCVAGDVSVFATEVWGRQARLSRAEQLPRRFDDLFSAQAVDELVSRRGLRTPFLRVAKDGTTMADRTFTSSGGVGATIGDQLDEDKLLRLFADGSTLVLQALHRTWPPLIEFSQQLAGELGHPVQVNAYVTPAQSRGFSAHYDVHDVLVLQIEGEKRWVIRSPVYPAPLRDQPWTGRRSEVDAAARAEPLMDVVLRPGDCLYLPRGFLHSATALGGVSTHLTVGIHTWTRHDLAQSLVRAALADLAAEEDSRHSLPLGVDVGEPLDLQDEVELVREWVLARLGEVAVETLARDLDAAARAGQRPAPLGPLVQLETAQALHADSLVVVRPHLGARLEPARDGGLILRSRAGDVAVERADEDAVQLLLSGAPVRVRDVDQHAADAVALTRRLLLAGVLVDAAG